MGILIESGDACCISKRREEQSRLQGKRIREGRDPIANDRRLSSAAVVHRHPGAKRETERPTGRIAKISRLDHWLHNSGSSTKTGQQSTEHPTPSKFPALLAWGKQSLCFLSTSQPR